MQTASAISDPIVHRLEDRIFVIESIAAFSWQSVKSNTRMVRMRHRQASNTPTLGRFRERLPTFLSIGDEESAEAGGIPGKLWYNITNHEVKLYHIHFLAL